MPANETFLRNLKSMHVVFAASSVALFGVTIWMIAADHSDEWRSVQGTVDRIEAAKLLQRRGQLESTDYQSQVAELNSEKEAAQKALDEKKGEVEARQAVVRDASLQADLDGREVRAQRAFRDKYRADYDLAVRDNAGEARLNSLYEIFQTQQSKVDELELKLQESTQQLNDAQAALNAEYGRLNQLEQQLKSKQFEVNQIGSALAKVEGDGTFSALKRKVMLWPIIDGFNSPHKIVQDWLPDLKQPLGMASTARFDRCRTCHSLIDRIEAGNVPAFPFGHPQGKTPEAWVKENKFPLPYATHPRPELYLTAASPHPVTTFGCTTCHEGQGSGTSFRNAEHTPNDPVQEAHWEETYHYHANHYWEYPMLPERFRESSCLRCHHNVIELGVNPTYGASAPKVFEGFDLVSTYGCFGCHEINGYDGSRRIGPDLRLEPNYNAAALQLLQDPAFREKPASIESAEDPVIASGVVPRLFQLAWEVADRPLDATAARHEILEMVAVDIARKKPFLTSGSHSLADLLRDVDNPGRMRKVGPALRYLATKTTPGWTEYWTAKPKSFRPTTRMPQFFDLTNQQDDHGKNFGPVEVAAITRFLFDKSQSYEPLHPPEGYVPSPQRGKELFAERGCLACHTHRDFPKATASFGPNLDRIFAKTKLDEQPNADSPRFSSWLYTWIRDPERHHPRTKMPNLFLETYSEAGMADGEKTQQAVDPAADIAAYLLQPNPEDQAELDLHFSGEPLAFELTGGETPESAAAVAGRVATLDELVRLFLSKTVSKSQVDKTFENRNYPFPPEQVKGDEIELARGPNAPEIGDEEWLRLKLNYVGRRTISRYGCYACHDIPGFEGARPIGTSLQDWGRKDTSRLAPEHIEEWLHHHGEADGSSTAERVKDAYRTASEFKDPAERERELSAAFYYESLQHHGRAGFLWQKLRQPRSYDYRKIETKGYDERLRMPMFPFNEEQIDKVATFVLGLIAEPPMSKYIYQPEPAAEARQQGELLLEKYNCTGCHIIDLPRIDFTAKPDEFAESELRPDEFAEWKDLLLQLKPPRSAVVNGSRDGDRAVISFHGLIQQAPDPEDDPEDQEFVYTLWETLDIDGKVILPTTPMLVPATDIVSQKPARGGDFAEWLVERLIPVKAEGNRSKAWQMAPPPLYQEGIKVQTPWLYNFLLNPVKLRHTTVLRMPRFNMSNAESRALANYFAAADGAAYPYQDIPQRDPPYLHERTISLGYRSESEYLGDSWKVLNSGLCIKCHSVGGREVEGGQPTGNEPIVRGPNLDLTYNRLRPEWLRLWLYNPQWITPYTSMPAVFRKGNEVKQLIDADGQPVELQVGNGDQQAIATRDALMNYHRLIESVGRTNYKKPEPPAAPPNAGE